jgi:hypothetical protein
MAPINAIRYAGEQHVPQDLRRRRKQVQETMRRMGTPVLVKHMYNDRDVQNGIAKASPNFDDIYKQTRHDDPISHGIGFVSVEDSEDEWVSPDGKTIVVSDTTPGAGYTKAPRYRGFGPGYLIYMIQPDVAEDVFKLTETGVLIKVQEATAQAPWWPEINDNDLIINVTIGRGEKIEDTHERYQAKMSNPITMRGYDRRGRREYSEDGGNRYVVNQQFQMTLIPKHDVLYNVETDR